LMHLQGLTCLGYLYLDETHVTDAGLVYLQGLKSLIVLRGRRQIISRIQIVDVC
jgi:hypothetical protein